MLKGEELIWAEKQILFNCFLQKENLSSSFIQCGLFIMYSQYSI